MQKNIKSMKSLNGSVIKKYVLTLLFSLVIISVFSTSALGVHAQTSGESIVKCGQDASITSACKLDKENFGAMIKGVLGIVITIGLPLLFIFVSYRFVMAWFSLQQGNANAYKDALQKAGNAIVGFLIVVVLVAGGLYTILSFFGVSDKVLGILKMFSYSGLLPHAYAAAGDYLPNYSGVDNLYDFILRALSLVMKFFIYPALIVIWVWTGFSFVLAQGAPEALTKAKKWLMWAFITTLVIMVLQGFLFALRASALKIIGTSPAGQASDANYSNEGRNAQPINVNNVNYSNEGNNAPPNPANYSHEGNNYPAPTTQTGNNGNN